MSKNHNENYNNIVDLFNHLKDYYKDECSKCWIKDMCTECPASLLIFNKDNVFKRCEKKTTKKERIIKDLIRNGEIY